MARLLWIVFLLINSIVLSTQQSQNAIDQTTVQPDVNATTTEDSSTTAPSNFASDNATSSNINASARENVNATSSPADNATSTEGVNTTENDVSNATDFGNVKLKTAENTTISDVNTTVADNIDTTEVSSFNTSANDNSNSTETGYINSTDKSFVNLTDTGNVNTKETDYNNTTDTGYDNEKKADYINTTETGNINTTETGNINTKETGNVNATVSDAFNASTAEITNKTVANDTTTIDSGNSTVNINSVDSGNRSDATSDSTDIVEYGNTTTTRSPNTTSDYLEGGNTTAIGTTSYPITNSSEATQPATTTAEFQYPEGKQKGVSIECLAVYNNCTSDRRTGNLSYCSVFRIEKPCIEDELSDSTISCTESEVDRLEQLDCGPSIVFNTSNSNTTKGNIGAACLDRITECLSACKRASYLSDDYTIKTLFCDALKQDKLCFHQGNKGSYCTFEETKAAVAIAECSLAHQLVSSFMVVSLTFIVQRILGYN